ncbi:SET domain protein [Aspergillus sclerotialis]|uniref:SET domain protein n=1 Tax=Aspergillus sclerotialis TaxID=2070753 RepID=A0A3A3A138_9EURO|nr:SET domain protein [Aspergillus sclerotialis]
MCFRTEAAACMKYMNSKDWQNYIPGTSSEGVDAQRTADVVRGWINIYLKESLTAIENLQAMLTKEQSSGALTHTEDGAHSESRKVSTILRRWIQIKYLCEEALKSVSSNSHVPLKPPT